MTALEYVKKLLVLVAAHGDLEVTDAEGEPLADPEVEYVEDDEGRGSRSVFVAAEIGYPR